MCKCARVVVVVSNGEDRFHVHLDKKLKKAIDARPETNKEIAHRALWNEIGGQKKSFLEMKIGHKDEQIAQLENKIADYQEELADEKAEREALVHKRDELNAPDEEYDERLNIILSKAEDGDIPSVVPAAPAVEELASDLGKDPADVHGDLVDRAAKQDRRLYNRDFMQPQEASALSVTDVVLVSEWDRQ